jgi:hypothetical protein
VAPRGNDFRFPAVRGIDDFFAVDVADGEQRAALEAYRILYLL